MHVSRGGQERAIEVEQAGELLTSKRGHPPTIGEIAEYLELDQEKVLDALQVAQARSSVSLDAPPRPGDGEEDLEPRADTIGVQDEGYALVEDSSAVAHALSSLSARERHILSLRFAEEMTQSEIAAQVGLSQMQVSRLLRHSLDRMRTIAGASPQAIVDAEPTAIACGTRGVLPTPVPAASAATLGHASHEEADQPKQYGCNQHVPENVRGEAQATEDGQNK